MSKRAAKMNDMNNAQCPVCRDTTTAKKTGGCIWAASDTFHGMLLARMDRIELNSKYNGAWNANDPDRRVLEHEAERRGFSFGY